MKPMRRVLAMRLNVAVLPPCLEILTSEGRLWLNGVITAKIQLNHNGIDAWLDVDEPDAQAHCIWMHWELGSAPQIVLEESDDKETGLDMDSVVFGACLVPADTATGSAE